ncbi:MAG: hypothetical protein IJ124_04235 [Clostridia bacterium]|nr:hypothetical protein [Clostridia bacterium]
MSTKGRPLIALRLDAATIAAVKISARQHGLTVSDLIRQLIDEQLKRDGIAATSEPLEGQMCM